MPSVSYGLGRPAWWPQACTHYVLTLYWSNLTLGRKLPGWGSISMPKWRKLRHPEQKAATTLAWEQIRSNASENTLSAQYLAQLMDNNFKYEQRVRQTLKLGSNRTHENLLSEMA